MKTYFVIVMLVCMNLPAQAQDKVRLITLDPGHFHAALVQKSDYPQVDHTVYVYAPGGPDLQMHLDRINSYNNRAVAPTSWKENVYTGDDFFARMIAEKKGNVVVLAGNNQLKTSYIFRSIEAGFNVFADKPMAINADGFALLKQSFEVAKKKGLLLYDIMTERYEITTILQRLLSANKNVFGTLQKGTVLNPSVTKESVHHFYKNVSGSALTRPAWFMDVAQEGEGIVDVTTHLVDLIQWECFPEHALSYEKDIHINTAKQWPTVLSKEQFSDLTKEKNIPAYLEKYLNPNNQLEVMCNGEINYTIKDIHAKVSVIWNYKAPEGGGDTHYSIMRGTRANLVIRQGQEQNYTPALYIETADQGEAYAEKLAIAIQQINRLYKGVGLVKNKNGWEVTIPDEYKETHEGHFAKVTEKYLEYLQKHTMPGWEVPNMIAKYYTTTQAQKIASLNK